MPTKRHLVMADKALEKVDWKKIDALSDEEIEAAARADPDNPLLTDEALTKAKRVRSVDKTAAE